MQDEFFTNIVSGAIRDENEMFVDAAPIAVSLPESKFTVIVIQMVDSKVNVRQRYKGGRQVFYFAVRNILQECLARESGTVLRNLVNTHEFIRLYSDESRNSERSHYLARNIHNGLFSFLRVTARFGISSVKQRPKAIPDAYLKACQAIESIPIISDQYCAQYDSHNIKETSKDIPTQWEDLHHLLESYLETGTLPSSINLQEKLDEALSEPVLGQMKGLEMKHAVLSFVDRIERGYGKNNRVLVRSYSSSQGEFE